MRKPRRRSSRCSSSSVVRLAAPHRPIEQRQHLTVRTPRARRCQRQAATRHPAWCTGSGPQMDARLRRAGVDDLVLGRQPRITDTVVGSGMAAAGDTTRPRPVNGVCDLHVHMGLGAVARVAALAHLFAQGDDIPTRTPWPRRCAVRTKGPAGSRAITDVVPRDGAGSLPQATCLPQRVGHQRGAPIRATWSSSPSSTATTVPGAGGGMGRPEHREALRLLRRERAAPGARRRPAGVVHADEVDRVRLAEGMRPVARNPARGAVPPARDLGTAGPARWAHHSDRQAEPYPDVSTPRPGQARRVHVGGQCRPVEAEPRPLVLRDRADRLVEADARRVPVEHPPLQAVVAARDAHRGQGPAAELGPKTRATVSG